MHQREKEDKLGDKLGDNGDKASGRRTRHPCKKGIQEGSQAGRQAGKQAGKQAGRQGRRPRDTPSSEGNQEGTHRLGNKSWETRCMGDKGDKASGRRTHHVTKGNKEDKLGDKGHKASGRWTNNPTKGDKKDDTREGGHTIQQRKEEGGQWETRGDKGDKASGSNKAHKEGDKRRQGFGKADMPSMQQRKQQETQWETRGDKTSGRRTHHPTKARCGQGMAAQEHQATGGAVEFGWLLRTSGMVPKQQRAFWCQQDAKAIVGLPDWELPVGSIEVLGPYLGMSMLQRVCQGQFGEGPDVMRTS